MKKVVLLFLSCLVVNTICMAGRPINLTCSIIDPSKIWGLIDPLNVQIF